MPWLAQALALNRASVHMFGVDGWRSAVELKFFFADVLVRQCKCLFDAHEKRNIRATNCKSFERAPDVDVTTKYNKTLGITGQLTHLERVSWNSRMRREN